MRGKTIYRSNIYTFIQILQCNILKTHLLSNLYKFLLNSNIQRYKNVSFIVNEELLNISPIIQYINSRAFFNVLILTKRMKQILYARPLKLIYSSGVFKQKYLKARDIAKIEINRANFTKKNIRIRSSFYSSLIHQQ